MQVWPSVEILSGKCVRLSQGDYQREMVFGESPADMATRWVNDGACGLHVVDLDAAREGGSPNFESISNLIAQVNVPVQLGGGIRDEETLQKYLNVGVERFVIGARDLEDSQWAIVMSQKYPDCIVVGLDVRDGKLATDGWQQPRDVSAIEFAQSIASYPIAGVIVKDIATDGMLTGPNFDLQCKLRAAIRLPVFASGGIANVDDVANLASIKFDGCIIGRALYEGRLTLAESMSAAQRVSVGATLVPTAAPDEISSEVVGPLKGPHFRVGREINQSR